MAFCSAPQKVVDMWLLLVGLCFVVGSWVQCSQIHSFCVQSLVPRLHHCWAHGCAADAVPPAGKGRICNLFRVRVMARLLLTKYTMGCLTSSK